MNRRERRAAKAKAKHRGIDPITALHEAGHAVGRYLTAPDMGIPEDKIITDIVVHSEGERPSAGTSIDGRVKYESLAVCNGPTLSAELGALVPAATEKLGISAGSTVSGLRALDLVNRHSPYTIQIRGNRTTFPPPRELYPLCSHPMA